MSRAVALCCSLVALAVLPTAAPASQVFDLGPMTTFRWSAVNNSGEVAGTEFAGTQRFASRWRAGAASRVDGSGRSYGTGISGDGVVFGFIDGTGPTAPSGGLAKWPGGQLVNASGEVDGFASVSNSGFAVGTAIKDGHSNDAIVLFRPLSSTPERFAGTTVNAAGLAVNDKGQVTWWNSEGAYLYPGFGNSYKVPLTGIFPASGGRAINNNGEIIGRTTSSSGGVPALRSADGTVTPVGLSAGATAGSTQVRAIADDRTIVGSADSPTVPLIWPQGSVPLPLDTQVPAGSGWTTTFPLDISPNGQWILTQGRNESAPGQTRTLLIRRECGVAEKVGPFGPMMLGSATSWSMGAVVSDSDGLVLTNVKLGERYLATRISLPYYTFTTGLDGVAATHRGELIADGNQDVGRSRLTSLIITDSDGAVRVTARYEIDKLPGGACLAVTQDYSFTAAVPGDHCEPTGKVPCARFFPRVSYEVLGAPDGAAPRVTLPQRLAFAAAAKPFNSAALTRDQDGASPNAIARAIGTGVDPVSAPVIAEELNPLWVERSYQVIAGGASTGTWDNFHQTYLMYTTLPRAFVPNGALSQNPFRDTIAVPGCPECVHMHWRWTPLSQGAPGFEHHNGGFPLIPAGSQQDVTIGIVRTHLRVGVSPIGGLVDADPEADPADWRALVDNESLNVKAGEGPFEPADGREASLAFWYEVSSRAPSETGFIHGGFYALDPPGSARVERLTLTPLTFAVDVPKKTKKPKTTIAQAPAHHHQHHGASLLAPATAEVTRAADKKPKKKAKKPKKPAAGATLSVRLREWGSAVAEIQQPAAGRRQGKRCVPVTKKNRRKKPCKRMVVLTTLATAAGTDTIKLHITGMAGKKALKPGTYTLSVRGRDLSGTLSAARTLRFKIVPKR